jgi:hypothetical protein
MIIKYDNFHVRRALKHAAAITYNGLRLKKVGDFEAQTFF